MKLHNKKKLLHRLIYPGVLVLGLVALASCQTETVQSAPVDSRDTLMHLVDAARWAQNAHNVQSWRFWRISPTLLRGGLDPTRLLPKTDPLGRQLILSLGALTETAVELARSEGLTLKARWIAPPQWNLKTDAGTPLFEWSLTGPATDAAAVELNTDLLLDVLASPTVKYKVKPKTLAAGFADGGVSRFNRPGSNFAILERGPVLDQVLRLAREAYTTEMTATATLMESFDYTVYGAEARARHPWGITLLGNFDRDNVAFIEFLARLFPQSPADYGKSGIEMFGKVLDHCEQAIVLTTSRNTPEAWFEAGRALQLMWLAALGQGGSLLPLSQGLQEDPQYDQQHTGLQSILAGPGETVQMIWAVGAPDGKFLRAPRIAARDLFLAGRPSGQVEP